MRIVVLADRPFLRRERPMLARLEIGLASEGVRVIHAVPRDEVLNEGLGVYSTPIAFEDQGLFFTRAERVRELVEAIAADADGDPHVDVVHCFGDATWLVGLELARQTGAALAVEVWRHGLQRRVARLLTRAGHAGCAVALFGPDRSAAAALEALPPPRLVQHVPWGVYVPDESRVAPERDAARGIVLLSIGLDPRAIHMAIEGIAQALADDPDTVVFLDADGAHHTGAWRKARRCGILDRLSLIPDLEGRREPILKMDLLLKPEACGQHHSATLDAMAAGMCVIAAADPLIDCLIDGRTARLIRKPSPQAWADAIRWATADGPEVVALTDSARAFVQEERSASQHVAAVLEAYEAVLHAGQPQAVAP